MTLKEIRKSKKLTQNEASDISHIPLRTYKRMEYDSSYEKTYKYINACKSLEEYISSDNIATKYNILIIGAGYVGFSLAILLSIHNEVTVIDINKEKVDLINKRKPIFKDKEIEQYLKNKTLHLTASLPDKELYKDKDYIILALPTDFDDEKKILDTSNIVSIIKEIRDINKKVTIIIKSTCPVGFLDSLNDNNIAYIPEFLREGKALLDNLYPTRIIIGGDKNNKKIKDFASLLQNNTRNHAKTLFMSGKEAEAVKLFSNAYLALRVSYFNELDSFALAHNMDTSNIIQGVSLDNRIGEYYNNPSFGYGGYCLPKDTLSLIHQMEDIDNNLLISSINKSNISRKATIIEDIKNKYPKIKIIGIYSLASKQGSDNKRYSAISDIITGLKEYGYQITYFDNQKETLDQFINKVDLILTNRMDEQLLPYKEKVYTRDVYKRD